MVKFCFVDQLFFFFLFLRAFFFFVRLNVQILEIELQGAQETLLKIGIFIAWKIYNSNKWLKFFPVKRVWFPEIPHRFQISQYCLKTFPFTSADTFIRKKISLEWTVNTVKLSICIIPKHRNCLECEFRVLLTSSKIGIELGTRKTNISHSSIYSKISNYICCILKFPRR